MARNLQILYGDQYIDWRDFVVVIAFFMRPETLGLIRRRENADIGVDDIIRLNNAMLLFQVKMQVSDGVSESLARYLHALRSFGVTDGKDKVFALLGLVKNSHHPLILPSYTKTAEEVFADTARYILTVGDSEHRMTVLVLAGIGQYHGLRNAASWVPNWTPGSRKQTDDAGAASASVGDGRVSTNTSTENPPLYQLPHALGGWRLKKSLITSPEDSEMYLHYRASVDTQPQMSFSSDSTVLEILGFSVDEVLEVSSVLCSSDSSGGIRPTEMATQSASWLAEVDDIMEMAGDPYPSGEPAFEILWRTLIGNRIVDGVGTHMTRPVPAELADGYRRSKMSLKNLAERREFYESDLGKEWAMVCDEMRAQALAGRCLNEWMIKLFCATNLGTRNFHFRIPPT